MGAIAKNSIAQYSGVRIQYSEVRDASCHGVALVLLIEDSQMVENHASPENKKSTVLCGPYPFM
jgi:hypothetical protein